MKPCSVAIGACLLASLVFAQNQSMHPVGSLSHVAVADSPDLAPSTGFTLETWIYPITTGQPGTQFVLEKINPTITPEPGNYFLNAQGGTMHFSGRVGTSVVQIASPTPLPQNTWMHVAVTYDNVLLRLYENGIQVAVNGGIVPAPMTWYPGELRIGCSELGVHTWLGRIDDVRIWRVARTQADVMAWKNRPAEPHPDLVAAWRFDGNYLDVTGNHPGTPSGAVAFLTSGAAPITTTLAAPSTVAPGANVVYSINTALGGELYVADVSLNGTFPGIPLPSGTTLPLNPPFLFFESGGVVPQYFTGFIGTLDAAGDATAILHIPPEPWLGFYNVSAAFVTLSPFGPLNIGFVGNSVTTVITGSPPASITAVNPPSASAIGGTGLAISGSGFHAGSAVRIGGTPAPDVTVISSSLVECTVPPGVVGPATVEVIGPLGTAASLAGAFTYLTPLSISSVAPLINNPGATVTVTGEGMLPGITLTLDGVPHQITGMSPTTVTFTAPQSIACNAALVLTNPDGHSAQAVYNIRPQLGAALINPTAGPAAGGNTVFISAGSFNFPFVFPFGVAVDGVVCTIVNFTPIMASFVMPPHAPGQVPVLVAYAPSGCFTLAGYYTYQ